MPITRSLFAPALLALGLGNIAHGASIIYSASSTNGFTLQDTTTMLPVGDLVRVGVFSISDATIKADLVLGDFTAVNNAFTTLGSSTIGHGQGNNPGYFVQTSTTPLPIDSNPGDLNIAGQQLYIWAMNVPNVAAANATTEHAILYVSNVARGAIAGNPNWSVPSDNPVAGSTQFDINDLTGGAVAGGGHPAVLNPNAVVVEGLLTPLANNSSLHKQNNFALVQAAIPEPTSTSVLFVSGIAYLARRRRKA